MRCGGAVVRVLPSHRRNSRHQRSVIGRARVVNDGITLQRTGGRRTVVPAPVHGLRSRLCCRRRSCRRGVWVATRATVRTTTRRTAADPCDERVQLTGHDLGPVAARIARVISALCASTPVWQPGRERPPRDEGGVADRTRGGGRSRPGCCPSPFSRRQKAPPVTPRRRRRLKPQPPEHLRFPCTR